MSPESNGKQTGNIAIWHRANGTPYNRQGYRQDFLALKMLYGLPEEFHWHDLRHVYATLMVQYQVNIRELAIVLGHANGTFTMQHYVVTPQKICEVIPEFEDLFLNAMPMKIENGEIAQKERLVLELPGYTEYTNNLIKGLTFGNS